MNLSYVLREMVKKEHSLKIANAEKTWKIRSVQRLYADPKAHALFRTHCSTNVLR